MKLVRQCASTRVETWSSCTTPLTVRTEADRLIPDNLSPLRCTSSCLDVMHECACTCCLEVVSHNLIGILAEEGEPGCKISNFVFIRYKADKRYFNNCQIKAQQNQREVAPEVSLNMTKAWPDCKQPVAGAQVPSKPLHHTIQLFLDLSLKAHLVRNEWWQSSFAH